jgi:predicted murein hydrolase (TIGR00659 family)
MNFSHWLQNPAVSIALTLIFYAMAYALHRRWRWIPPIVVACLPIAAILLLFHESCAEYNQGADLLTWLLGPATVGLAVPMYRNGKALRSSLPKLALIVLIGSVVGMTTAGLTAWLLGAPLPVVFSMVPKSVTTPIAIEVCRELKGIPQITIAMVILAGVLGASFGVPLLRLARVRDDRAIGAAIGTGSHGVGTASLVHRSELQTSVSSWAMAAAGIFTSLLAAFLTLFLR